MGSRMMHYCISTLLSHRMVGLRSSDFMLGGIAPDAHKYMPDGHKSVSHFVDRDELGRGSVNYGRFYEKYREHIERREPFYLGYYCHLISDAVWSTDTYVKKLKRFTPEEKQEILQLSYRDFRRLNGRIAAFYGLELGLHAVPELTMDEVSGEAVTVLLQHMERDFRSEEAVAQERLELFHFDEIREYIEKSVYACLQLLS